MIPPSRKQINFKCILTWSSLSRLGDSVILKVHLAKTIQHGERIHSVPLAPAEDPLFCPVRALEGLARMVGHHNITANTPVFQLPARGGGWIPVQRSDFSKWVNSRLEGLGLDSSLYTLHGFRRGGVIELTHAEPNRAICMEVSDHASDAFQVYCSLPADRRLNISRRINNSLSRESASSSPAAASSRPW